VIALSKHIFGSDDFFFSLSLVFFFFFFLPEDDDDVLISSFLEEAPDEKTFLEPRDIFSSFSYSRSKQNERERERERKTCYVHKRARGNTALLLRRVVSSLVNKRAKSKRYSLLLNRG